jgi:hypothetical protein
MSGWLAAISPWHWLLLGVALVIAELISPAAFFMWLAMAAGLVGLVLAVFPGLEWLIQLLLFAAFSLLGLWVGRRFFKRHPIASDRPNLNRRGHQYVGRVFVLEQPVANGAGRLRVDDTVWKITGPDCPAGTRVRVAGVDGVILRVELGEPGA